MGGLFSYGRRKRELEIYNFLRRHVNAIIKDGDGDFYWKFIGFYKHPKSPKQAESWVLLKHLKSYAPVPWLCTGDFNEIMDQYEKEGAAVRWESQMDGFRTALEECQLCDMRYI